MTAPILESPGPLPPKKGLASLPHVVPSPQEFIPAKGTFPFLPATRICVNFVSRETGEFLAMRLRQSTGFRWEVCLETENAPIAGAIFLSASDSYASCGDEGYELTVEADLVHIRAREQAGLFYGVQTLLQLLPPEIFSATPVPGRRWELPCLRIVDRPRFEWRGMMLDVSRHFFNTQEVKHVLDLLALHKINRFHWHLVDSVGWRIEIEGFPGLTETGAWRCGVLNGLDPKSTTAYGPDGRYGGFYTRDDIREIVAYARARHITIIPEIEMPGHSGAVLSAYPDLQCLPATNSYQEVFCAGNDAVFDFFDQVLAEVVSLFPGKYIHIGGDEVKKDRWKACERCQARIQAEGLKDENELQSDFIRRIEKIVNARNRTLIGWSEILEGGLAQTATVMDWIGGAQEAASTGHDVVMSPNAVCYFDYYQSEDANEPRALSGIRPLRPVYDYDPIPANLAPQFHHHILGVQGNLWTEYICSAGHLEYMMFPRLSALAEVAWSPKAARDWEGFKVRLQTQLLRFDQLGIRYRRLDEAVNR